MRMIIGLKISQMWHLLGKHIRKRVVSETLTVGIVINDMVIRYGESLWPGTSPRPGEDGSYDDQPRLTRMGGRVGCKPFPSAASSGAHVTSYIVSSA